MAKDLITADFDQVELRVMASFVETIPMQLLKQRDNIDMLKAEIDRLKQAVVMDSAQRNVGTQFGWNRDPAPLRFVDGHTEYRTSGQVVRDPPYDAEMRDVLKATVKVVAEMMTFFEGSWEEPK